MSARSFVVALSLLAAAALGGCAAAPHPYDYTNFRAHPPHSILVLPPLNQSTDLGATYGWLSTATQPLAELGYYVFPVEVVDTFFKENGLPTAGEMHQAPLERVREITGADAVLFVTVEEYGSKYLLVTDATTVRVHARLVDTHSQVLLWEGRGVAQQNSSGSGSLLVDMIGALVAQMVNSQTHPAHELSRAANQDLFHSPIHGRKTKYAANAGLPYGPYSPKYQREP